MQPPIKPRRPPPDARGLPMANAEPVPGYPKQSPSPRAMEAARAASRVSSPEVHDVKIDALEDRVDHLATGLDRVTKSVDTLVEKVAEWELKAAGGEAVKIQEEQKTKRWTAMIGVLTMVVAPLSSALVIYLQNPSKAPVTEVHKSAMQIEEEACQKAPSDEAFVKCVADVAARNAPQRHR